MQATIRSLLQQIAALGSGWSAGASAFGASAVAAVEMTAASEWPDGAAASPAATSPSATTGQGAATVSWTPPSGPARSDFVDAAAAAAPAPRPAYHSCWRAEDGTEEPGGPFVVWLPRLGLPLRCISFSRQLPAVHRDTQLGSRGHCVGMLCRHLDSLAAVQRTAILTVLGGTSLSGGAPHHVPAGGFVSTGVRLLDGPGGWSPTSSLWSETGRVAPPRASSSPVPSLV
jgi:hypothetical protein